MKIPPKIKIGGHWLKIKYRTDSNDAYSNAGSARHLHNLVVIAGDMAQSKKESVLMHEIIHELNWQLNAGLSEEQTSILAEGIYQVLVDNKWLK